MNYGMDTHLMSNILKYLEESVTFLRKIEMDNLMQKVKKLYSQDIPQEVNFISV